MLYENVCTYAKKKNMSIAEVEKRAELGNATIQKWKETNDAKLSSVAAVAKVLGVKIDKLAK